MGASLFFIWPATWWHEVEQVRVIDAGAGDDFEIVVVGGPLRDFEGSYQVTISEARTGASPAGGEHAGGVRPYSPTAVSNRPSPITISWWAPDIDYEHLPPGDYIMSTCWTVHHPFIFFPAKSYCVDSNVFVLGESPDKSQDEEP